MQLRFSASINGQPKPEVQWYKNDDLLTPTSNIEIMESNTLNTLLIKSISVHDAGVYKVTATNEGGTVTSEATLTVDGVSSYDGKESTTSLKPLIKQKINDCIATEDEDLSFKIEFDESTKPQVQWEKNRHNIVSIRRVKVINTRSSSELRIQKCRFDDSGTYTVSLTNTHGLDACTFDLQVKGE